MSKSKKPKSKQVKRRTPKRLSHTLYSYVEPVNGKYARGFGAESFGSFSSYIDVLILLDRKHGFSKKFLAEVAKSVKTEGAKKPKKKKVKAGGATPMRKPEPTPEPAEVEQQAA